MLLSVLGSGSKGNSTYVSCDGVAILIDAGFSLPQLKKRIKIKNLSIDNIAAIFITHEHSDHWIGAFKLAKELNIKVHIDPVQFKEVRVRYSNKAWCKGAYISGDHKKVVKTDTLYPCRVGPMVVNKFDVPHDTSLNRGFTVTDFNHRVGITTDLGCVTQEVYKNLSSCDVVMVEANHDIGMLIRGSYPQHVKDRVMSQVGHLSNDQCASFVKKLDPRITKQVILAHISEENNSIDKINDEFFDNGVVDGPTLNFATQDNGSDVFLLIKN
jgi:phosphoribosyl 1,2-cyclic phosphodiesterase